MTFEQLVGDKYFSYLPIYCIIYFSPHCLSAYLQLIQDFQITFEAAFNPPEHTAPTTVFYNSPLTFSVTNNLRLLLLCPERGHFSYRNACFMPE